MIESELLSKRIFLVKATVKIGQISIINFVCKINPWTYKLKDLNEEKIIESRIVVKYIINELLASTRQSH